MAVDASNVPELKEASYNNDDELLLSNRQQNDLIADDESNEI